MIDVLAGAPNRLGPAAGDEDDENTGWPSLLLPQRRAGRTSQVPRS